MTGTAVPSQAMVLAAGLGQRMRPLTLTRPKPLLTVAGITLLDHALDRLAAAGVETAVVNHCYLGEMIAEHLAGRARPRILLSPEPEPLETGGGIKLALDHFGVDPFVSVNADILWLDGATPAVQRLAKAWDADQMDALLLLMPTAMGPCSTEGQRLGADQFYPQAVKALGTAASGCSALAWPLALVSAAW